MGAELATHLASQGWNLCLHYHDSAEAARELALRLHREYGSEIQLLKADLCDPGQRDRMGQELLQALDSRDEALDLVIHNASLFPRTRLGQLSDDDFDSLMALHVKAPLFLTRQLAPALRRSGSGLVIHMLDSGATRLWPAFLGYCLSKECLRLATLALARQFAPHVRVCGIAPGFVLPPDADPEAYEHARQGMLLEKEGSPRSVTHALAYLLQNDFVTGEILTVDGGYSVS